MFPALAVIFGSLIGRAAIGGAVGAGVRSMAPLMSGNNASAAAGLVKSSPPVAGKPVAAGQSARVPNNLTMSVKHLMAVPERLSRMREHQFQANNQSSSPLVRKIHQDEADYEKRKLGESTAVLGVALKGAGKGFVGLAATLIAFPKIAQTLGENQLGRQIDRFSPINAEYRNIAASDQTSKERAALRVGAVTQGSVRALQEAVANLREKRTESQTALGNAGNIIAATAVNIGAAVAEGLDKTGIAKAFNNLVGGGAQKKLERNPQDEFIEDVLRGRYIPKKNRLPPPPKLGKQ